MYYFRPQALTEAAVVGGVLAVIAWAISSQFTSPIASHFVAGAIMHLSFEFMGIHHHFAHLVVRYEKAQKALQAQANPPALTANPPAIVPNQ